MTHPNYRQLVKIAAGLVCMSPLFVGHLHAGNTWDGGGTSGSWSDLSNWDANTTPVSPTLLTFGGTSQLASSNDLFTAGTTFNGITFESGAGAFTLSGNSITLGNNVTNSSSSLQTINNDLILNANRTFTSTTGNMAVGGVISGAFGVTKTGAGTTLTLSGINTFTGGITSSGGTLSFNTLANAGASSAAGAAATSGNANLIMSGGTLQYTGTSVTSDRGWRAANTAGNVFEVTGAATNLTLTGGFSDNDGDAGDTGSFTKTGSGTLTLTGVAAGNNLTVRAIANQGTLALASTGTATFGRFDSAVVNTGATLQMGSAAGNASQITNTTGSGVEVNAGGTLDILGSQSIVALNSTVTGGTITSSTAGSKTVTVNSNTINSSFGGVIENGSGTLALTKSGALTTLTLSGVNTYTGATTVSSGTLLINGSLAGTAVSVANTGILGGTGTIGGATTFAAGSKLSAGDNSASLLTFSSTLDISAAANDSAAFVFTLGTASDRVNSGALTLGSGLLNVADFSFTAGSGFGAGTYTLFDATSIVGTMAGSGLTGTLGGFDYVLSIAGNDVVMTVSAIPEPSTFAALAGVLTLGLAACKRRRVA